MAENIVPGNHSIAAYIEKNYPEYWGIQQYPAENSALICKKDGEWGLFSNFADTPIVIDGVTFKSTEHLFQTMKFTQKEDVEFIYLKNNKKLALRMENEGKRRPDWGEMIVDAMKYCLVQKYEQSEAFRKKLESSRNLNIMEDESNRKRKADAWGVVLKDGKYVGPNLLGRLLMELRVSDGKLEYHLPDDALKFIDIIKAADKD